MIYHVFLEWDPNLFYSFSENTKLPKRDRYLSTHEEHVKVDTFEDQYSQVKWFARQKKNELSKIQEIKL